jgi:hypothetical protein
VICTATLRRVIPAQRRLNASSVARAEFAIKLQAGRND